MRARKELRLEDLTFLIDSREQRPLEFTYGSPPEALKYVRTETCTLDTGDYSVKGLEKRIISIERKSLEDLIQCVGSERERFEREIHRLLAFPCRLIVVEASWDDLMLGQWRGKVSPKSAMGSVQGWIDLGIPFFFHRSRQAISDFVRNLMFIRARRSFESLLEFQANLKLIGEQK